MKVLMLGGAGFIGQCLSQFLMKNNVETTVIDQCPRPKWLRATNFIQSDLSRLYNINNIDMDNRPTDFDAVLYMAAMTSRACDADPETAFKVHCEYPARFAKQCKGIFIFFNTAAIYHTSSYHNIGSTVNEDAYKELNTVYKISKHAGEIVTLKYAVQPLVFRLFNVYGPCMREDDQASIVTNALLSVIAETSLKLNNVYAARDFIYVSDVCEAIWKGITTYQKLKNRIFNVCTNIPTTVDALVTMVEHVTRKHILRENATTQGNPDILVGNNNRIMLEMDWRPKVTLEEGLMKYYSWRCHNWNNPK